MMPYTILYIEDESAIIELLHIVVQHPDVRLVSAFSAAEGLRIARAGKLDLILLDVMIPDRNGWSVYSEIRADAALKTIPVIMLTGQMHRYWIKKEFEKSPIDAYITKPFDVSAVRTEIETMLNTPFWSAQAPAIRQRETLLSERHGRGSQSA